MSLYSDYTVQMFAEQHLRELREEAERDRLAARVRRERAEGADGGGRHQALRLRVRRLRASRLWAHAPAAGR
ncbi:MAG: hypothetical protein ACLGIF_09760 [Actinomycetes bacterium]